MSPLKSFRELFLSDARRYFDDQQFGRLSRGGAFTRYFFSHKYPGLRYTYWMRLCNTLYGKKMWLPLYAFALNRFNHYKFKFGIMIPFNTQIGKGFYIGHFCCIVVNPATIIGKNVNISQGVTIGAVNRGDNKGIATIGDGVYRAGGENNRCCNYW